MHVEKPSAKHLVVKTGPILLEMVMIVFSILLALGLESCHERSVKLELAETALTNIRAEIMLNRTAVDRVLPGHRALQAHLNEALAKMDHGEPPDVTINFTPLNLVSSAWETASATQALVPVDFQKVQLLARLYTGHHWIQRFDDTWMAVSANPQNQAPGLQRYYFSTLRDLVSNYIGVEEELLRNFDAVLAHFEDTAKGRPAGE